MIPGLGQPVGRAYTYDGQGRPSRVDTTLDGKTYDSRATWDAAGRPLQSFFKAWGVEETGELAEYNAQGYAYRVRSAYPATGGRIYSEVTQMNARGQVTEEYRAAGARVSTTRQYDPATGRLTRIQTGNGYLQDLSYTYDARCAALVFRGIGLKEMALVSAVHVFLSVLSFAVRKIIWRSP